MTRQLRIGLTMREGEAKPHGEPRDCLAHDWAQALPRLLPGALWLPVPNLGPEAADFARHWDLTGLIFTGGGDPGADTRRDRTEAALFALARQAGLPVLGVCRGFQALNLLLGGRLSLCEAEVHVGARHPVRLEPEAGGGQAVVNSFHNFGIAGADLAAELLPLAWSGGQVEAAFSGPLRLLGLMWHPERPGSAPELDATLLRRHFGAGQGG